MTDTSYFFVQFPDPGGEHNPPTDDVSWNVADHRRKFLIASGRYLGTGNRFGASDLVFWGEWEPQSHIERRWPAAKGLAPSILGGTPELRISAEHRPLGVG